MSCRLTSREGPDTTQRPVLLVRMQVEKSVPTTAVPTTNENATATTAPTPAVAQYVCFHGYSSVESCQNEPDQLLAVDCELVGACEDIGGGESRIQTCNVDGSIFIQVNGSGCASWA